MGRLFVFFQGDDVKELEKEKDKRVKKIEKLTEEVKAIDEKIAEIKSEG
jgi:chaperonin cofactor prefoldin